MRKSPENDHVRLRHMLDWAQEAVEFADGETRYTLEHNRRLQLALIKASETVGEAANQITSEFQRESAQIPRKEIIGMRHRLVHVYHDIALDVVWSTVVEDLPILIAELQKILAQNDRP